MASKTVKPPWEVRSDLLDEIAKHGAIMFRKKVGRFDVAIVLPGEESMTNEEGYGLCRAIDELLMQLPMKGNA